ncbi:MAG TPA: heme ABC exporter ATP-binding protein CcmA [Candidatus Thermoplasmatota archaeon]|nr:heme ABC exporter ATP-binding protein CcmA [Candidatus Thermoplasmatota archaeon]
MIVLEGVTKRYGRAAALRDVSLQVPAGSITLLAGENGAGKSTLLRLASTLEAPSAGTVHVAGHDTRREGVEARAMLQYVGHNPGLYDGLTAEENLRFFAGFHLEESALREAVPAALRAVGLSDRADSPVGGFSRGMRQRLALARALIPDARVLLLDEPFTGLDAPSQAQLTGLLREWRRPDRALLLTTHDLEAGLALADRAIVLRKGRVAHESPAAEVTAARLRELLGGAP